MPIFVVIVDPVKINYEDRTLEWNLGLNQHTIYPSFLHKQVHISTIQNNRLMILSRLISRVVNNGIKSKDKVL